MISFLRYSNRYRVRFTDLAWHNSKLWCVLFNAVSFCTLNWFFASSCRPLRMKSWRRYVITWYSWRGTARSRICFHAPLSSLWSIVRRIYYQIAVSRRENGVWQHCSRKLQLWAECLPKASARFFAQWTDRSIMCGKILVVSLLRLSIPQLLPFVMCSLSYKLSG